MGCGSCGSGGCSSTGCGRNGGCATGGCNKLNTFDWLGNMLAPDQTEADNVYEVRFKNTRKGFYRNVHGLRLFIGDAVVVESDRGYDVGTLSLGGIVARLQMKKKHFDKDIVDLPRIYRKANERDLEQWETVRNREIETRIRAREIIDDLGLDMKLSDVEFQGDNAKAIFYYIADHRVDFRELIKILAREFRIRVEMKQIGLRHEAGLVGGIGSCGRELCCSTWLTEFKTVSTSAARYQNLSLNPMKISGLCGRLKCCLNFELDSYLDALQDFPEVSQLTTHRGVARLQKTDIFKKRMWFCYDNESIWHPLDVEEVKRIVEQNKAGKTPEMLKTVVIEDNPVTTKDKDFDFVDVVGKNVPQTDTSHKSKKKKRKKPPSKNRKPNESKSRASGNKSGSNQQKSREEVSKSSHEKKRPPKSGQAQSNNSRSKRKKK